MWKSIAWSAVKLESHCPQLLWLCTAILDNSKAKNLSETSESFALYALVCQIMICILHAWKWPHLLHLWHISFLAGQHWKSYGGEHLHWLSYMFLRHTLIFLLELNLPHALWMAPTEAYVAYQLYWQVIVAWLFLNYVLGPQLCPASRQILALTVSYFFSSSDRLKRSTPSSPMEYKRVLPGLLQPSLPGLKLFWSDQNTKSILAIPLAC